MTRDQKVWCLWKRMPVLTLANEHLWRRFNETILRKFGPA